MRMITIILPVYNDWTNLIEVLKKIEKIKRKTKAKINILVVNDSSTNKFQYKKFNFKKTIYLNLKKNIGSQKAIATSLKYLNEKKNRDFNYITIMDGDGEDNPNNISLMLNFAKKNKDSVVVSCRKDRNENFLIKFGYKIHLFLTFIFTIQWMSFGNFSCFHYAF